MCSEIAEQTTESLGELFVPCEMPEAPKNNSFLKVSSPLAFYIKSTKVWQGVSSIFGGTPRQDSNEVDLICGFSDYSISEFSLK